MSKRAFVTGGTGFIGINLVNKLIDQDWDVTALHRPTSDLSKLINPNVEYSSEKAKQELDYKIPPVKNQ
jgi:nucleoside-diphosphate-sugar epimerase